jgi:ABC-2 type transport system permease protein
MNLRRVALQTEVEFRTHLRSKIAMFWSMIFPVFLFALFAAIFSNQGNVKVDLWVQDKDATDLSHAFVENLTAIGAFNLKTLEAGADVDAAIKEKRIASLLIIPSGCEASANGSGAPCLMELRLDQSSAERAGIVHGVVQAVAAQFNLGVSGQRPAVAVAEGQGVQSLRPAKPSDYYLSGIITMSIITTSSFSIVESVATNRDTGLLRKLASTPMTRAEWLLGKMLYLCCMNLATAAVLMVFASGVFGATVKPHPMIPVLILAGTVTYAGLGLLILRIVKQSEGAIAVANGIVFPMLFLSGAFIPVDFMPPFMQDVAKGIPLTYLNDGLRQVTIYGDLNIAAVSLAGVGVVAIVFVVLGVFLSKWSEEYIAAAST